MRIGLLKTQPFKKEELGHGAEAILVMGSGMKVLCKVLHLTPHDEWVVSYSGAQYTLAGEDKLCYLVAEFPAGVNRTRSYGVHIKDWKNALKTNAIDTDDRQFFTLEPIKFKSGQYGKTCTMCTGYFEGSRSQPVCEDCCKDNAFARLKPPQPQKKRSRLLPPAKVKEIAEAAFNAARLGAEDFDKWYSENY